MAVVDGYASTPWYLDHVRPVMAALNGHAGRTFVAGQQSQLKGDDPIFVVQYGDLATVERAKRTRIALGQHGIGQSYMRNGEPAPNPCYPGGRRQDGVGLFLVPNETAAHWTRWRYPRARIEIVGCPKLDVLPEREGEPGQVIAISAHWPGPIVPEAGHGWATFGRTLLGLSKRYEVLGHAHPLHGRQFETIYRNAGIEYVPTFEEICRRADLYITDNSSTLYEFAATGRNVLVLNPAQYRPDVIHGLRFWQAAHVGINVNRPEDLEAAVERAFWNLPGDVALREHALSIVYQPRRGGAALAAAALVDWLT